MANMNSLEYDALNQHLIDEAEENDDILGGGESAMDILGGAE